ncbi:peptidoglycan DD-metalloendopeptidase family protein [Streptomyces sp. 8N706]|uniref:peptidoglycan DD-metalloendopeptidase family protein n=1 Tax=Streptomyces sp. 8N706 TaxID=3457416 RepID=UPI003FD42B6B
MDLATRPGATVRAAASGRVSFAGSVAGRRVLAIELDGTGTPPLRVTYEPVRAGVRKGDRVTAGEPVGTVNDGPFHCPSGCLHWGLRRGDRYLDPLSLLPAWMLRGGPSRLLPVFGVPEPQAAAGAAAAHRLPPIGPPRHRPRPARWSAPPPRLPPPLGHCPPLPSRMRCPVGFAGPRPSSDSVRQTPPGIAVRWPPTGGGRPAATGHTLHAAALSPAAHPTPSARLPQTTRSRRPPTGGGAWGSPAVAGEHSTRPAVGLARALSRPSVRRSPYRGRSSASPVGVHHASSCRLSLRGVSDGLRRLATPAELKDALARFCGFEDASHATPPASGRGYPRHLAMRPQTSAGGAPYSGRRS